MEAFYNSRLRSSAVLRAVLLLCCWASVFPAAAAQGDDATTRYFEQLRRRRLYSLAEGYCLSRLAEGELTLRQRSQLTIELSRTFSEHARYAVGDEQSELWRRSRQVIDELLDDNPANPRQLLLEAQRALVAVAAGEHLRWQTELYPYDKPLRQRAVAAFDEALPRLRKLEETVSARLRKSSVRRPVTTEALSPYELRSLSYHMRHHIGRVLIERARLDESGSPDRVALAIEAESWLGPLAKGAADQRLTLDSRLLLAESYRLRGDRMQAAQVLNSIEKEKPPRDLRDRLTALRARLLLDVDRATDAAQLLSQYRIERLRLPGELQFLKIKALAGLWQVADRHQRRELAGQLMEQIAADTQRAESEIGGFWAYRCRLLLESTRESQRYGSELAASVRKARLSYAAGRTDDAADEYGRAFAAAVIAEKSEIAMELGFTRASIQLQANKHEQAAEGFRQLAAQFPSSPQAASAHLLWAYCLGKLYNEQRTKPRRERYTDVLIAQRTTFPQHATAAEATWMLALLEEQRLQITRALKLYQEISPGHNRGSIAQVAVARCYEKILDRLRQLGRPRDAWENTAVAELGRITAAFPGNGAPLNIEQAEVCLRFARILLNQDEPDYQYAGRMLDRIELTRQKIRPDVHVESEDAVDANRWKPLYQATMQLRIVTLAGRGSFREAEMLVRNLSATNSDDVLSIVDGLSDLTAHADQTTRRRLGELQLQASRDLDHRRAELTPQQQRRLDRCLAQAYVATGQSAQAIDVYDSLLSRSPKDRLLLRTVAELLTRCGTPACYRKAKKRWKTLESLEKPGGTKWINARYQVAWCAWMLKEYDECRKLLAVTRLVYPKLGGSDLRGKFTALEKKLKNRR
jgi:TolA-binding protein